MTPRARKAAVPTTAGMDPEIAALGYEQARDALVDVVRRLESGAATLEESLQLWERGEALATRCEQWLQGARARLDAADDERPASGAARPAAAAVGDHARDDEDDTENHTGDHAEDDAGAEDESVG